MVDMRAGSAVAQTIPSHIYSAIGNSGSVHQSHAAWL